MTASLSPSGRWLATVDSASEIRIWEPATGGLAVLRGSGERNVSFMGDDRLVAVAGEGWIELIPFSARVVVPHGPAALSGWLAGLTTAEVNRRRRRGFTLLTGRARPGAGSMTDTRSTHRDLDDEGARPVPHLMVSLLADDPLAAAVATSSDRRQCR